jgi:protein-tyrosine phosphatase
MGLAYFRIPVTDHYKPRDDDVDAFMIYYLSKPEGSWTHIHCRGGRGRTATFLTITDMLQNAKKVSFEDIMDRQMRISEINLLVPTSILQKKYKLAFLNKLEFLRQFYLYCKENDDNFKTSWTTWKSRYNQQVNISSLEE